ncbi:FAD-binding oxidoreductase [Desulfoscipio gibsoniae]|uniref:FAD/FMN-dependent dehydrogenase n=1 Tax=Desulfoscipio gibsoniae DSM 7213 TaxID=767817 RepID=R4KNI9_9FIRM|nr:FAD-linked oxidase C-terminal domain-containing protein [Desulfoscipio gibsoniae]AGL02105.1 FAD/FMN-dependent dehydrogenase [Desulfoscipio gibsoniae DSM 7213]
MALVTRLGRIVGEHNVFSSREERVCYAYDGTFHFHMPDVVVKPQNAEQIAQILKLANDSNTPVFPRGAGTGLSGGSLPVHGGIAMVLTGMDSILEIDAGNQVAVVEPGVVTGRLHAAVAEQELFYPPDPASLDVCTIGGNIAECAGGPRGVKYGVTRDYVLGLELVTPTGDLIKTGGKTIKNVTGYDLTRLMVGSEGTLGIVTKALLRLIPLPGTIKTVLAVFDDLLQASDAILAVFKSGVIPATMEIMDAEAIKCVVEHAGARLPRDADAVLLIEVDGCPAAVEEEVNAVAEACLQHRARSVETASTPEERNRLWQARRAVSPALVKLKPTKISEDATVPRAQVPAMIRRLQQIREKYDLNLVIFGHAGDGNLHPNIIADERDAGEMARVEQAVGEIFQAALELGGTLSGEHGIGTMKTPYMQAEFGTQGLAYMRRIKKSLDPNNILNPGKIFSE